MFNRAATDGSRRNQRNHFPRSALREEEGAFQIRIENKIPVFFRGFEQILSAGRSDPRVVDEQVDPTEMFQRLVNDRVAVLAQANVALFRDRPPPIRRDLPSDLIRAFPATQVVHRDGVTLSRHFECDSATNTAGGASDECCGLFDHSDERTSRGAVPSIDRCVGRGLGSDSPPALCRWKQRLATKLGALLSLPFLPESPPPAAIREERRI